MQALIPFIAALSLASGAQLNLLPYAYLASPIPVFHQTQNTRTGEHAYSYAGGPSAKEEVKGADGVMRGSYSYIDANGILQSVFYVADENGFRVAATNLPTDDDLPVDGAQVLLAEDAYSEENGKSSRRKRSLQDADRNANQKQQDRENGNENASGVRATLYRIPDSNFIPYLFPTATSHQSQVQIHRNVQPEALKSPNEIHLATPHQSQVQIRDNLRVEVAEGAEVVDKAQPVDAVHAPLAPLAPIVPVPAIKAYQVEGVAVAAAALPSYHENRIQLHKALGLEGAERKNAIKINAEPLKVVQSPIAELPAAPTFLAKEVLPVVQPVGQLATASFAASISSHGVSQIHGDSKVKISSAIISEPAVYLKTVGPSFHFQEIGLPFLRTLPYATASHYRTQVHSN